MAMAAANAVLDIVLADGFLDEVKRKALLLKQRLAETADTNGDIISEVRGEGLLIGLKCNVPNTQLAGALQQQRLLTIVAGDNVVRLLPPLVVSEAEINEACEKINSACASLRASPQTEG
jgi:acetylornithine/N-succinyldiaminopimelate aminotransferase